MDISLSEIVNRIYTVNREINTTYGNQFNELNKYMVELSKLHTYINDVNVKLCNVYNICKNIHANDNKIKKNKDLLCLSNDISKNSLLNKTKKIISDDISINVKCVESIDDIPCSPVYWVNNINQFAIRINDTVLRGNIGNIYNSSHIKKNIPTNNTVICKNRNNCKKIQYGKICKFYHDPLELIELLKDGKITMDLYEQYIKNQRNFINTSWLYTENAYNNKNTMLRHFGSKNTLKNDIDLINLINPSDKKNIMDNFMQQTMHDLLVTIIIDHN